MPVALRVSNLWKAYLAGVTGCSARVWALRGCSLAVRSGERLALVGPAFSGKTTLLHCIGGLRTADAGSVIMAPGSRARVTLVTALRAGSSEDIALLDADHERATAHDQAHWWRALESLPRGRTIVLATRDRALADAFADRVLLLDDGRIADPPFMHQRRVAEHAPHAPAAAMLR